MIGLVCSLGILGSMGQWMSDAEQNIDQESLEWAQELTKGTGSYPCRGCNKTADKEPSPGIRVLMSLDVPLAIWQSLSNELQNHEGSFVLRGLPENSFRDFAIRLKRLREAGVLCAVQIDPRPFTRHGVEAVPAFLLGDPEDPMIVRGSVSLRYALERAGEDR